MSHVHIDDDLRAMEITCWAAFISAEQEAPLLEMLLAREVPDNQSFEREFGMPGLFEEPAVSMDDDLQTFLEGSECYED